MDWENEAWVKLYTRESHDMLAVGWEGRALFRELLCRVDRAGVLDCADPAVLSELVRMPSEIVEPALDRLVSRKTVTICDGHLVIPNFLEAQEAKSNDKERKRRSRETKRAKALLGQLVTNRDKMSPNESQNVTECPGDQEPPDKKSPLEENRREESRGEERVFSSQLSSRPEPNSHDLPAQPDQPQVDRPSARPAQAVAPEALELAQVLVRAIARRQPGSRPARQPEKCAQQWSVDIDRLHRLDERPWGKIRDVLEWSQRDSFWQSNILSGKKLREKFDALESKMGQPDRASSSSTASNGLSAEEIWRMAEEEERREEARGAEVPFDFEG